MLAPALTEVGIPVLSAHLFVFYFATISVITPPVCVAVFVASGIAQTNWMPSAVEAVRLGAMTYLVPFLILLYPGLMLEGGAFAILDAVLAGLVLVVAIPALLSDYPVTGSRGVDRVLLLVVIVLAAWQNSWTPIVALLLLLAGWQFGRRRMIA